jgi:outer membrane protein assembly factor BamB
LDKETGEVRWQYDTAQDGGSAQFHGDPLITEELVITGSDQSPEGYVYAFERSNGEVRWKTAVGGLETDVLQFGASVMGGTSSGEMVVLDLKTGQLRWRFRTERAPHSEFSTLTPALVGDVVYFGGPDGSVYALDAQSGKELWRIELGGRILTPVRAVEQHLFVGIVEGKIFRLDRATGAIDKELATEAFPHHGLAPAEDSLLVLLGESKLASLDLELEGVRWQREADEWSTYNPLLMNEVAVVGTGNGEVLAVKISDGSTVWSHPVEGMPRGLGVAGPVLYIGTLKGSVYALRYR